MRSPDIKENSGRRQAKARWPGVWLGLLLLEPIPQSQGQEQSWNAGEITSIIGRVEVARSPDQWDLASTNKPYRFLARGHRVRTLHNSRATIVLYRAGNEPFTMQPDASFQVPGDGERVTFFLGLWHFFGRSSSQTWEWATEKVFGSVGGTDFILAVKEDGEVIISVAQGLVRATNRTNPTDTLELHDEQAGRYNPRSGRLERVPYLELAVRDLAQTFLYYPGVLYLRELNLEPTAWRDLAESLQAYSRGDLPRALSSYPVERRRANNAERLFYASLVLVSGQYQEAQSAARNLSPLEPGFAQERRIADAILEVIASAQPGDEWKRTEQPNLETEWLAESYYQQSRAGRPYDLTRWERKVYGRRRNALERALVAAKQATPEGSTNGFGWVRRAELEFSFGHIKEAEAALTRAREHTNYNAQAVALLGFLSWAKNDYQKALALFQRARDLDPRLGNARLGLGLTEIYGENLFEYIRRGKVLDYWDARPWSDGLRSLEAAVAAEPERSALRSYLGKAYYQSGGLWGAATDELLTNAFEQICLAKRLDRFDPTPDLYSALIKKSEHRINEAVEDLQRSAQLNKNRQPFRSTLMLDEDAAVRSASLASIYTLAGMPEVSLQEAAKGVSYDYANYSSHLFMSDSFDALRDPTRFNLRYETVWFNELLLANILAPVGAGRLSQAVSAQEYSRLFAQDGVGLASATQVRSDGILQERASQFGTIDGTAYALDLDYQHHNGVRPNNELDSIEWYSTIKQRVTAQDTALVLVKYEDYHSGDNFQYYDPDAPGVVRPNFKFDESQEPILVGAWHHEWSPGMHTMFLAGRLVSQQHVTDQHVPVTVLLEDASTNVSTALDVDYQNSFQIYSAEVNQICEWDWITLSVGARYQAGTFHTQDLLDHPSQLPFLLGTPAAQGTIDAPFERITGYGYLTVQPVEQLRLTGGLAYDQETIPRNFRHPPVVPGEEHRSQLGPKAGVVWNPCAEATVRGIYTRSLGGVSLDESYRLEPAQLAGFPQAFRSLISESVVGSVAAPTYETFGLALDLHLGSHTFAGIQAERLTSEVQQQIGVFRFKNTPPAVTDSIMEQLDYEENSLAVGLSQLLGQRFVVGARYKWVEAQLQDAYPALPSAVLTPKNPSLEATLQTLTGFLLYQHPSGLFAQANANWYAQRNSGYSPALSDEGFFQGNIYLGYRFPREHGELRLGLLNVTGQNYRLNPLTVYEELPRKRVLEVMLAFQF